MSFLETKKADRLPTSESEIPSEEMEKFNRISNLLHPDARHVFEESVKQLVKHRESFRFHRDEALNVQSSIHDMLINSLPGTREKGMKWDEQEREIKEQQQVRKNLADYQDEDYQDSTDYQDSGWKGKGVG